MQQIDHAAGVLWPLVNARRIVGIDRHDIAAGGPEARAKLGISDGFIRFSTGLEHADDLIEDLAQALEKV
jgi:O-acetylhomoserine/O-acetylserine sulfhydrylase-like pyridoxal-dependent enzyme